MKRLIVTGDDLGLSSSVVAGIAEAHRVGVVTSTSVMVNAPAAAEAFALARSSRDLAVGIHFVLTFGEPVGDKKKLEPMLDRRGRFLRDADVVTELDPEAIATELGAQLDRFTREIGWPPTHLDSHHHVHKTAPVLEAVIAVCRPLGIPVRSPDEEVRQRLLAAGLRTSDHFIDSFFGRDQVGVPTLSELLQDLREGTTELMCHPAQRRQEDPALDDLSSYVEERFAELDTLTHPWIRARLQDLGIDLIPWTAL